MECKKGIGLAACGRWASHYPTQNTCHGVKMRICFVISFIVISLFCQAQTKDILDKKEEGFGFRDYYVPIENIRVNPDSLFYSEGTWRFHSTIKSSVIQNKCQPNFAGHYMIVDWGCGAPCSKVQLLI